MPVSLTSFSKGHRFPPVRFELSRDWVQAYVAAVEDEAIARLARDYVPPMAVAALSVRALLEQSALPEGAIHLGQELAFQRPVQTGETLAAVATIAGRAERQGWSLMVIDLAVSDQARQPVMTGRATLTFPQPESDS